MSQIVDKRIIFETFFIYLAWFEKICWWISNQSSC